jgi:hypothetical protein
MVYKGKNHSIKLQEYHFCTTTAYYYLWFSFYSIVSLERVFCNGTRLGIDKFIRRPGALVTRVTTLEAGKLRLHLSQLYFLILLLC